MIEGVQAAAEWQRFVGFLPRLGAAVLIFLFFWALARLVGRLLRRGLGRQRLSPDLIQLVAQVSSMAVLIFGAVTALGTLGVDTAALVAGLGLTGFALGFALKDVISNFLAGFLVLLYQPFQRGDRIKVLENEGRVVEINFRYTVLETPDRRVLIPNATLLTNAVVVEHAAAPDQG